MGKMDDTQIKKLTVRMHLGRVSGGNQERMWHLTIEDVASSIRIAEIEFDATTFNDLMSHTTAGNNAVAEVFVSPLHGLRHEHKTVWVPRAAGMNKAAVDSMCDAAEAAHPGWRADRGEGWNGHRLRANEYSVSLRRWVP